MLFNSLQTRLVLFLVLMAPVTESLSLFGLDSLLRRQASDCGTDPDWQPTAAAWKAASVDSWLQQWWSSAQGNASANFVHDLASDYGPQSTDFTCGIGETSRCSLPGCNGIEELYIA